MMGPIKLALLVITAFAASTLAVGSEVISDLTVGSSDETRALAVKAEQFWGSILTAAAKAKMAEHAELHADAEKVIAGLDTEHSEVKQALSDALAHLRHADDLVLVQAIKSTQLASDELKKPIAGSQQATFSFFTGGQMMSVFTDRLRRFASEGTYSERLVKLVEQRQADVLPILQGELAITGDVLTDCHRASQRSFDVLKHDLYRPGNLRSRGKARTPDSAKAIADRMIEAAKETRSRFVGFMLQTVLSVAEDTRGKQQSAAATVTQASMASYLKHPINHESLIGV
jgi:hypothetical protein